MVTVWELSNSDLDRLAEIDRSEEVYEVYKVRDGALALEDGRCSMPPWFTDREGGHSVAHRLAAWRPWLEEDGGTLFGAFDVDRLAGLAVYRPAVAPGTAQLAVLHVSRPYRRQGVGAALTARVIEAARRDGAKQLYVSATPTRGTVDFYRAQGFTPTEEVIPELHALEPEDIHMRLALS